MFKKTFEIPADTVVAEKPIKGFIEVRMPDKFERAEIGLKAIETGKKDKALEAQMQITGQREFIKAVKKVDITWGEGDEAQEFKNTEALKYYDQISELFTNAFIEFCQGPQLGKS